MLKLTKYLENKRKLLKLEELLKGEKNEDNR